MDCKLCGQDNAAMLFQSQNVHGRHMLSGEVFDIYKCRKCGVAFTDVEAKGAYYDKYYPPDYYEASGNNPIVRRLSGYLAKLCFQRRLSFINRYSSLKNEYKILEIGCGRGEFLDFLPSTFKKYGVEINRQGYAHTRKLSGDITVFDKKITDPAFEKTGSPYDVIGMWHVLEHIDEPHIFLQNAGKLLSKEGTLIFDIPNPGGLGFHLTKKSWFHLDVPRHLFLYNRLAIQELMKRNGFKIIHYSGNPIDYFQDLSVSLYKRFKTQNIFIFILVLAFLPLSLAIRMVLSIAFPELAEINTYVVKQAS